jgi:hypothetical protein
MAARQGCPHHRRRWQHRLGDRAALRRRGRARSPTESSSLEGSSRFRRRVAVGVAATAPMRPISRPSDGGRALRAVEGLRERRPGAPPRSSTTRTTSTDALVRPRRIPEGCAPEMRRRQRDPHSSVAECFGAWDRPATGPRSTQWSACDGRGEMAPRGIREQHHPVPSTTSSSTIEKTPPARPRTRRRRSSIR